MVGSDEVGLLGELFMLPYCTSPHVGLPRPHPSASDAKHITYQKREIFQGQVFWEFSACPNKHYSMFRHPVTFNKCVTKFVRRLRVL
jgi:hypothetical protein